MSKTTSQTTTGKRFVKGVLGGLGTLAALGVGLAAAAARPHYGGHISHVTIKTIEEIQKWAKK